MVNLSLLQDFITEAVEHLDEMESSLLQLEADPDNRDILNDIFRSIHTIKGASQFTGIDRISKLSHAMENLLDQLRTGTKKSNQDIIDTLIEGKDRIMMLVNELEQSQAEASKIDDLLVRIEELSGEAVEKKAVRLQDKFKEDAPDDIADESLEDEGYAEEFDEELSAIFIHQLTENLTFLHAETNAFATSSEKKGILDRCLESVCSLQSAANYMGYEKLTRHYKNWRGKIESAKQQLATGKGVSLAFMGENIDKILDAFPQIKDVVLGQGLEKDLEEAFTSIDELEAISDELEFPEMTSEEAAPQPPATVPSGFPDQGLDGENYTEEFDAELSEIFINQLKEAIALLRSEIGGFAGSPDQQGILDRCQGSIHSLQSAANYMGYEKLTRYYKNWCSQIESAKLELASGKRPSLDFMKQSIDTIIKAFPRVKDAEEGLGLEKDLEEAFTSIDELEAMTESSALADSLLTDQKAQAPVTDARRVTGVSLKKDEYAEDYDEELFEIFIKQLKEKIPSLQMETDSLRTATNKAEVLKRCLETIQTLQASANYMGYDQLTGHYKNWCAQIEKTTKMLAGGYRAPFGFMNEFISKIKKLFPQIGEGEISGALKADLTSIDELEAMADLSEGSAFPSKALEEEAAGADSPLEMEDFGLGDTGAEKRTRVGIQSEDDADLFDKLSSALDIPDESSSEAGAIEDALFNKLSSAFDSSMESPADFESEPMADVLAEMLFAEEKEITRTPSAPAKPIKKKEKPPAKPVKETPGLEVEEQKESIPAAAPVKPPAPKQTEIMEEVEPKPLTPKEPVTEAETKEFKPRKKAIGDEETTAAETPTVQPDAEEDAEGGMTPEFFEERRKEERRQFDRRQADDTGKKVFRQSVRVDADKIDYLMNQVGELVVSRAFFVQLLEEMKTLQQGMKIDLGLHEKALKPIKDLSFRLSEATVALGRVSNDLQEGVMRVRMLPISQLFNRYPRLVRDLVKRSDKKVNLEIRGGETELDKMVIEEISDPLIHLIRNAVDHGIEAVSERKRLGKPETGTLILEAYHESNHIIIEITDDGRGIDIERIKAKAAEKGLFSGTDLDRMSVSDIQRIIMMPGFSTSGVATQTSGRGVGMDVVKKNVEKLNGTIEIESQVGAQTMMRLKIPLTLAIIPALMVRVGGELFTIPLSTVEETLKVRREELSTIEGVEVIHLRSATMPIFRLSDIFSLPSKKGNGEDEGFFVVVVSTGMQRIGLVVDDLIGQEEVVIKPLEDYLREQSGFSGATIIGDGRISLILDIYELIKMTGDKQIQRHQSTGSLRKARTSQLETERT